MQSVPIFLIIIILPVFSVSRKLPLQVPPEQKLREYLQSQYFWLVRPVANHTDQLLVFLRFGLVRIVDLSIKDQVFTLQVSVDQKWTDYKLHWNPDDFNGITQINLPSDKLWLPDLLLFNSALGEFRLQSKTVLLHWTGLVQWKPYGLLRSFCRAELRHYPFDIQTCLLSFGSWTYKGDELWFTLTDPGDRAQRDQSNQNINQNQTVGMDLTKFHPSTEWDLIALPGHTTIRTYPPSPAKYLRIKINVTIRRQSSFYLVNLVLPFLGLSFLSLLSFYLPADCDEKITLCMSLLTSKVTFLLLMIDNIPVTSLAVPLLGKMIIFSMVLTFFSVLCTAIVLNIYHRQSTTHQIPKWVKNLRRRTILMKLLLIDVVIPESSQVSPETKLTPDLDENASELCHESLQELSSGSGSFRPSKIRKAYRNIQFVRDYLQRKGNVEKEREHWKFLAAVTDRIFLVIFNVAFFAGMAAILTDAPALFDQRKALDKQLVQKF